MKRTRFVALAALLAAASLYAGVRIGSAPPGRLVHPLTGRPIAGIATDATWMERASREAEESPDRALSVIGVRRGMTVADIGAGSGYMTLRIAPLVGATGKVYATDIQPALLRLLQQKLGEAHVSNVEVVLGSETDTGLPDNSIDIALLVDVYHEFQHPKEMLRSIRRSMKFGGQLVLVESARKIRRFRLRRHIA
ncbi:MAG TPA: methyltransferase domain-containing protein [Vicinamibacterales bacterium]|nr:methyltransferase domain-containing protein [Vicinamibacterales bacterium]